MKIALIGYGKMGHMIEQIARERGHEIVSIIDIDNAEDFESETFATADVAIEFTAPQAAYGNYLKRGDESPLPRGRKDAFLGLELLCGHGHFPSLEPLSGQHYEPVPAVRREHGGDTPRA